MQTDPSIDASSLDGVTSKNTPHLGISVMENIKDEKPTENEEKGKVLEIDDAFREPERRTSPLSPMYKRAGSEKSNKAARTVASSTKKEQLELDDTFQTPESRENSIPKQNLCGSSMSDASGIIPNPASLEDSLKSGKEENTTKRIRIDNLESEKIAFSAKNTEKPLLAMDETFLEPPTNQSFQSAESTSRQGDSIDNLPMAKPYSPENLQRGIPFLGENQGRKRRRRIILTVVVIFLVAMAIAIPLAFVFAPSPKTNSSVSDVPMEPSSSPSLRPSLVPSSSPSYSQEFSEMIELLSYSSNFTSRFDLERTGTSQNRALHWLLHTDESIPESNVELLERYSLVVLYFALGGEYWSRPISGAPSLEGVYLNPSTHICNWTHPDSSDDNIRCKNRRVTQIYLAGRNLTGQLPQELGILTQVERLLLQYNQISGEVPEDIIGNNMQNLEIASFLDNALTGELPEWIGTLPNLVGVSFGNNYLTGSLPQSWLNISKELLFLDISKNLLTGSIESLRNFKLLSSLYINDNFFDEGVDEGFFRTSMFLTEADFSQNRFSGPIPSSFTSWLLESLDLNDNFFTGTLPLSFRPYTPLLHLNVRNNRISGGIAPVIANWENLISLDISSNQFTGELPETLSSMKKLEFLSLSNNSFSPGEVPNMENCTNLKDFALQRTSRTGLMPDWLGNMEKLVHLDLSFNNLSGLIPKSLWDLPVLDFLFLRNNQLSGTIPTNITFDFGVVLLERNNLTGEVNLCGGVLVADCEEIQCTCCSECCYDGEVCNDRNWIIEFDPDLWFDEFLPGMNYPFSHNNDTYQVTTPSPSTSFAPSTSTMPSAAPSTSAPTRDLPERSWNGMKLGLMEDAKFGYSVSLSHDGSVLAIGAPSSDFNGTNAGFVNVYTKSDNAKANAWVPKGSALFASKSVEATLTPNSYFGNYISLSTDGSVIAVGAKGLGPQKVGFAIVFHFNSTLNDWQQLGQPLYGFTPGEEFADAISLSGDASTLAVGARFASSVGSLSGQVRVFRLEQEQWVQRGSTLNGAPQNLFGTAVSLNYGGDVLAVSSPYSLGFKGQAFLYRFQGEDWNLTRTFYGQYDGGLFGQSLALNSEGTILAISSPTAFVIDLLSLAVGIVYVYQYRREQSDWQLMGTELSQKVLLESFQYYTQLGSSVALSASGYELLVSAKNEGSSKEEFQGGATYFEFDGVDWVKKFETNYGGYYFGQLGPEGMPIALSGDGNTFALGDNNTVSIFYDELNYMNG